MASPLQLTLHNATPQRRQFFILCQKLETARANSIALGAWQRFTLDPGQSDRTALSQHPRISARSQVADAEHQTLLVKAAPGSAWDFGLDAGTAPVLTAAGESAAADTITVTNRTSGPAVIGFTDTVAPLLPARVVEPGASIDHGPVTTLYFYVTVPLVEDGQPIVFVSDIGELTVPAPGSTAIAQFYQDANILEWRFT